MKLFLRLLLLTIIICGGYFGYQYYKDTYTFLRAGSIQKTDNVLVTPYYIQDKDIDIFLKEEKELEDVSYLNKEQLAKLQSLTVLYMHDFKGKAKDVWASYAKDIENLNDSQLFRFHKEDYDFLYSYFYHRNAILDYGLKDYHIIECEYDNLYTELYEPLNSEIWERYRTIGGGNGFYEVNGDYYYQCTTFAWARFFEVYGYDSGAVGNGCLHAQEIVRAHPTWFQITTVPFPGATFSTTGNDRNKYGHTGFVEAFDGKNIWISEGNIDVGGIRFNYMMSLKEFYRRYPNVIFASPVNYHK